MIYASIVLAAAGVCLVGYGAHLGWRQGMVPIILGIAAFGLDAVYQIID